MSKRILLIDSDENFAQGLQAAFHAKGFTAVTATDSEQGIALAREETPDLIVVCVEAQPTNGYMLCTRLRKDEELKGIPIILTSANATEESFEKHSKLKTRAEEYLIKPFAASLLLQKASALLGVAAPSSQGADEPLEEEIVSMEDEPLGLGDLVADEDEPIQLTDSEAAAAHEPEAEILEESVEVEIEEEQAEEEAPARPHADDDLQMFDQAFDALGMAGEEPAPAPRSAPPRPKAPPSRPPAPSPVRAAASAGGSRAAAPAPRVAERTDDELAFDALDALDASEQVIEEDGLEPEAPPARKVPLRGGPASQPPGARGSGEKEIQRLKEELEDRDRQLGDLQAETKALQQRADALAAAAKKFERELSQSREELNAVTGEKDLLAEEREELRQKLSAAESDAARNEERAVKAYQKMKGDERLREKTRKALQVALQLLDEGAAASESREASAPEKQSA